MRNLNELERYREPKLELKLYGTLGDGKNGVFKVKAGAKWFFVIASTGGGWEHVSITMENGDAMPSWNDMCRIKDMFFDEEEAVMQLHPKRSQYVNMHKRCLHLWRPTYREIPCPPSFMV
jgi:hypothetical protein